MSINKFGKSTTTASRMLGRILSSFTAETTTTTTTTTRARSFCSFSRREVGGSELLSSSSSYYSSSWRFWKGIESAPISSSSSSSSSSLVFVRGYKRANRKVSVVLREQTKHLGKKSEVVSVKPGRARNHLIPLKLAKYATEENVAEALREKEERDGSEEEEEEVLDEDEEKKKLKLAIKMLTKGNPVTIKRATKRKTEEFNIPITKDDVAKEVAKQKSVDLDTKSIMLDKPIDSLGEFDVPLWIDGRELEEKLKVVVKKKAYK